MALVTFVARTGLLRLAPSICEESPWVSHLGEAEADVYCSMMYRRTVTADARAGIDVIQTNAELVAGDCRKERRAHLHQVLDVGHHVHSEAPDPITADIRSFLQRLEREGSLGL